MGEWFVDLGPKVPVRIISLFWPRLLPCVAALFQAAAIGVSAARSAGLTFEKDVRPIFKAACFRCHGEDEVRKGELDLRLVRLMVEGGESGTALKPGAADGSLIWKKIAADEMPKGEHKLSAAEKSMIRSWIEQGAKTARPEPEDVADARFTLEELGHWAFQPVQEIAIPVGRVGRAAVKRFRTPIDAFIQRRLEDAGLASSERAEDHTLIRRLHFDLTGLPPTPVVVVAFLADTSGNAYERLVDRLLASPQFGVRWGRHWLDAAGFAETDGGTNTDADPKRPHAWRYRDYVMDAFNANKPVDIFIREQVAGDEMIEGELDVHAGRQRELLTATGFLRMAPDATQTSNAITDRNAAVADVMRVVSASMLGLTVGCAQCHDHKYDPIGIDDYYRLRAVFDPAFPLNNWQRPNDRLVDMTPPGVLQQRERIEAEAAVLQDDLTARKKELGAKIQELKLADVPEKDRAAVRAAVLTASGERTDRQKTLLDLYPMVKPVANILGLLIEYDMRAHRKFEAEQKKIDAIRARKPPLRMIMATTEPKGDLPVSRVFSRGDPETPRDAVEPAPLRVLRRDVALPENEASRPTTGRRLSYARQLTDGRHPTAARVFVNRLWLHHLGRGIVATPGDFGIAGEQPSHPELLDWLANELVEHGWDQKRLHRMIVSSATYRQRSQRRPELDRVDPENALGGRANLRRLEAEAIRDALLAVAGNLDTSLGGPSIPVTVNSEGKAVIGVQKMRDGLPVGVDEEGADGLRRSAFIEVQRRLPLNMLATFDQPAMTPNCAQRRPTTVATQALWFLNDAAMVRHAGVLAKRLLTKSRDRRQQLGQLYLRLFGQLPSSAELRRCEDFLTKQESLFAGDPDSSQKALASLCQVLLASNRFLYVD